MDTLLFREIDIMYKGESYTVSQGYYIDDNGEEYTTTESDQVTIMQVYDTYNEKYAKK